METIVDDNVVTEQQEEEKSDIELKQELVDHLKKVNEKAKNMWLALQIRSLEEEIERWYDENGQAIPPEPDENPLNIQVSPEEVLNAEGWWTHVPSGFWPMPTRSKMFKSDPQDGLELSNARSNGAFLIKNLQETALAFIETPEDFTEKFNTTRRIIRMAGYKMKDRWYLLPTSDLGLGRSRFIGGPYALQPEVPFTEEEDKLWVGNFIRSHFSGAALAGADWQVSKVFSNPEEKVGSKLEKVDTLSKYVIPTVANHPNWIVPRMMDYFNTWKFKLSYLNSARSEAHRIDRAKQGRVPGYETIAEMQGLEEELKGNEMTRFWEENEKGLVNRREPPK